MLEITAQRAREFGIEAQGENETDCEFKHRISGILREQGHIIEAHEAFQNALYDQSDDAITGIMGAMAQALAGRDYSPGNGARQVGDDIAAGHVSQKPKDDSAALLGLMSVLLGM